MLSETKTPHEAVVARNDSQSDDAPTQDGHGVDDGLSSEVPWTMKFVAVLLITAIGFGSHWSSGVTGAMKSTLKKVSTVQRQETKKTALCLLTKSFYLYLSRNSASTIPNTLPSTAARTSW